MNQNILKEKKGFTIIEVLVGAVVFMLGFSILVFMLNQAITKRSIKDLTTATHLGEECLECAFALQDTLSVDSIIGSSNVSYQLIKSVEVDEGLAIVKISISRPSKPGELCKLYGEFNIP